jgi:hypothetical protein
LRVGRPGTHNGLVENHLDRVEHVETPPELKPRPTGRDVALGIVVVVLFAFSVCAAAILSFELNPAVPVVVVVAAIAGGSFAVRRVEDYAFKALAIGLVVGGIAAILFWPFFDVS